MHCLEGGAPPPPSLLLGAGPAHLAPLPLRSPPQPIPEPKYPLRMMLGRYTSTVNGRLEVFRADPNVKPLK